MRQFTFILFYLLWHAHDGSVLAAFSCMHFLYPTGSLATFSPNNNKISGHNTNHTWLIKSSPLEKTTYVHASTISFHLFTCELHIPSCYRQMHIGFQIGTPSKYTNNWLPHDPDYIGFTKIRCQHEERAIWSKILHKHLEVIRAIRRKGPEFRRCWFPVISATIIRRYFFNKFEDND